MMFYVFYEKWVVLEVLAWVVGYCGRGLLLIPSIPYKPPLSQERHFNSFLLWTLKLSSSLLSRALSLFLFSLFSQEWDLIFPSRTLVLPFPWAWDSFFWSGELSFSPFSTFHKVTHLGFWFQNLSWCCFDC